MKLKAYCYIQYTVKIVKSVWNADYLEYSNATFGVQAFPYINKMLFGSSSYGKEVLPSIELAGEGN